MSDPIERQLAAASRFAQAGAWREARDALSTLLAAAPDALAANSRLESFEETVKDLQSYLLETQPAPAAPVAARPKLTVCGGTG